MTIVVEHQLYRHDRLDALKAARLPAETGYYIGVKLVAS
jgi:hypothetical protein